MKQRLILFSGMGGDARLLAPLRLPEFEVFTPDHVSPQPRETLPAYAARVAKAHSIHRSDIVGGASFGGMLACEIAKQQGAAGLILLGSCVSPKRLPISYRLVERFGRLIPDFILGFRSWGAFVRWRFAPIHQEAEA
jgi:surfactin synthase thioesterase subunit